MMNINPLQLISFLLFILGVMMIAVAAISAADLLGLL